MTSKIQLVDALQEGAAAAPGEVVLVANDQKTRFAVNIKAFSTYSKFAEAVLTGDIDGEMPLDSDRAPPETVKAFCTWLKHHETVRVSKIAVPLPRLMKVDDYYTDPWDIQFIRDCFVGPEEDMTKCAPLYSLALFSVYLQVKPLTQMLATFFAWHIKKGIRETGEPTKLIARWFGRTESYTVDEVKEATDWVRDALKGMQLPQRRTMESDDEFSVPPMSSGDALSAPLTSNS